MLNVDDVGDGVKELERCAKLGLVGAMIAAYPLVGRSYDRPEYDPLWAAAQDLGMPLSLHAATNRAGEDQQFADLDTIRPTFLALMAHWAAMSLGDIIFSPNPPKDTDGRREDSGRVGEGATGEMAGLHWGRLEVGGRSSVAA